MIGMLIMSHGQFAAGTLDSLKLFMGQDLEKVEALCLGYDDSPDEFEIAIKEAIARLDDGSGVVGLCDLAGGTPGNICTRLVNDRFHVIMGYNIGFAMELLGRRFGAEDISEIDFEDMINICKERFIDLNSLLLEDDD